MKNHRKVILSLNWIIGEDDNKPANISHRGMHTYAFITKELKESPFVLNKGQKMTAIANLFTYTEKHAMFSKVVYTGVTMYSQKQTF